MLYKCCILCASEIKYIFRIYVPAYNYSTIRHAYGVLDLLITAVPGVQCTTLISTTWYVQCTHCRSRSCLISFPADSARQFFFPLFVAVFM